MVQVFKGNRVLAIGLGAFVLIVFLGLFQNFSEFRIQSYDYTVTDIGNLGGPLEQAVPTGINRLGHVVGQSQNKDGEWHAFLWNSQEGMKDLGTLGGNYSRALRISDADEVFGVAINKKGEMRRFRWSAGAMKDLGAAHNDIVEFDGERAVGSIPAVSGSLQQAAVWEKDTPVNLGTLGGGYSLARNFNSQGVVVGEAENPARTLRPTIWIRSGNKTVTTDLFSSIRAPKLEGRAFGVNDNGEVVGQAVTDRGSYAFVWNHNDGTRDLNKLVRDSDPEFPKSNWTLTKATAISDCGQVTGEGIAADHGAGRAFVLTPVDGLNSCKK